MKLCWLCPTWNRPTCLRNLITQFLAQDYPAHDLDLLILDDTRQYENQVGDDGSGGHRWQLISFDRPIGTLGDKYNALLAMTDADAVIVAEDDDLYLPHHSAACAHALRFGDVCKPTDVLVEYGPRHIESDPGRFHASLAINTAFAKSIAGWPTNKRADFDLQMIAKLRAAGTVVCPQRATRSPPHAPPQLIPEQSIRFEPSYCFRWETSRAYHVQAYGRGPTDEDFLQRARAAAGPIEYVGRLFPETQNAK